MDEKTQEMLRLLRLEYSQNLPTRVAEIRNQWNALNLKFNKKDFIEFHRLVHSLHGSAGTYGYNTISQVARDLEIYINQLIDKPELNAIQKSEISHLVEKINDLLTQPNGIYFSQPDPSLLPLAQKLIYWIGSTKKEISELKAGLEPLGYQLNPLPNMQHFQKIAHQCIPSVIILDICDLNAEEIAFLARYKQLYKISIICIAKKNDLATRLKAIRAGVTTFLQHNVDTAYLIKLLDRLCTASAKENYRILILDDSPTLANYYALILNEAGMIARGITEPMELLQEMDEFNPDLLLIDLYMPSCTGFELAAVLRQEPRYMGIPIIFISTEDDRFKQFAILSHSGGDDFLTKPVLPQHLISAVKARAKRSSLLISYITHDNLTRVFNHSYILQQLELEILRAKRHHQTISFAMIDLDHFKTVNDEYGHPTGDLILKNLAKFLRSRFRETDFIGRYGGDEFAVIFPDTPIKNAISLCRQLRQNLAIHPFEIDHQTFHITLSIGIAAYPHFQTTNALVTAADEALYAAKSSGRNQEKYLPDEL